MTHENYDLVIIGGGPGGLSAALWANEVGLRSLLLDSSSELGGQLLRTYNRIENHLGATAENGLDLRNQFIRQIEKTESTHRLNSPVTVIDPILQIATLQDNTHIGYRDLIIATGVRRRELNVPGETRLRGKGLLDSGKREAAKAKDKVACVIGGGDAAFENALILSEHAQKIYLIHRRSTFTARPEFTEQVISHSRIEMVTDTVITEIIGDDMVTGIKTLSGTLPAQLSVDIIVTRIGVIPNSEIAAEFVSTDERGYILVDSVCRSSSESIYAIGDVANPDSPTISSAVGMGATAVKHILRKRSIKD